MKAKAAIEAGRFAEELVPIHVDAGRKTYDVTTDEPPRFETTLESLTKLKPAFRAAALV